MFAAILPSVVVAVNCVKQGGEVGVVQEEEEVRTGMGRSCLPHSSKQQMRCSWISRFFLAQLVSAGFWRCKTTKSARRQISLVQLRKNSPQTTERSLSLVLTYDKTLVKSNDHHSRNQVDTYCYTRSRKY
jgi:hypothetical protein